jgi:hypothetical protein
MELRFPAAALEGGSSFLGFLAFLVAAGRFCLVPLLLQGGGGISAEELEDDGEQGGGGEGGGGDLFMISVCR